MNKELEQQLAIVLEKGLALAEKTGEFVIEQGTDLVQEFYYWHFTSNIFYILLGIMVFMMGRYGPHIWVNLKEKPENERYVSKFFNRYCIENDYDGIKDFLAYLTFIIGSIISFILLIYNTLDLLKLIVSPKLYLIEYFIK